MSDQTEPIAWPDWLADSPPENKVRKIVDAVAECYGDSSCRGTGWHETGGELPHCTAHPAGDMLLRLLEEARESRSETPDPYPLPGSGVTLWHSVSSFEAVQITEGSDLDAVAQWCGGTRATVQFDDETSAEGVRLLTRHGHVTATEGDWIAFDGTPASVWSPTAFPARFEPVVPVTPEPAEPPREMCPETHPAYQTPCTWLEQHGSRHRDASGAEWLAPLGEPEPHGRSAVGICIREARQRAGMTQEALAERLKVTQTTVSRWESASRDVTAADLLNVANALGVPASSLMPVPHRAESEAHRPVPLLPDGTFVEVQIKGFQHCEGYLTAGMWHGEPYGFLADKDGAFVAAFPPVAGSVHLITAVPEPGSEPERPDPWAPPGELESARAEVTASRRLLAAAHLKAAALGRWAAEFVEGDSAALAEVRAILERDFTPGADDAEPPF